jgi:hypothetical protein
VNTNGLEQRRSALKTANERRTAKAEIKRQLAVPGSLIESQWALANLLDEHGADPAVANARLSELLLACRGVHLSRMRAHLRAIHANEFVRVAELSDRQLDTLLERLRNNATLR